MNETLASLLSSRAAERPDHPFVSFPDGEVTYGELHERAAALARGLLAAGLKPGGHIGILMTNCVAYLELLFAIHLAGGVPVPFNARFRQRELAFVIAHYDIEVLVTTDLADEHTDFTGLLTQALPDLESQDDAQEDLHLVGAPKLRRIYLHGTKHARAIRPLADLIAAGQDVDEGAVISAWSSRTAQDTALLLYTSGTTADPKGCELTHEALVRSWSAYAELVGFEPDQSMWTPCPFFHVGGIGVTVSALVRGATIMSMNWFEPEIALAHIEKRQAEHLFPAFPPLTLGLLRAPGYDPGRLTFVRTILNVAPADTQRVIESLLPKGTVLLTDFGMTEGAGMITVTPRDAAGEDRLTRNGTPLPGIEVRVTNPEDPKTIQPNDLPGEIQFRGINAFRAYYKNPAETAATIIDDGWVRTPSARPTSRLTRSPGKSASSPTGPCQRPRSRNSACASCCYSGIRRPCGRRTTCDVTLPGAWRELMAQSDLSGGSPNPFAREGTGFLCHGSVAIQVCLIISARDWRAIARC